MTPHHEVRAADRKSLGDEASKTPRGDKQDEAYKLYAATCKRERLRAMIDISRHMLAAGIETFDSDPYLLNCRNGTMDLRTGAIRRRPQGPHHQARRYNYDREAKSPRFQKFLREIFKGDARADPVHPARVRILDDGRQRRSACSSCRATAATARRRSCRRSRFVAGEYGQSASPSLLLAKKNDGGIPNDVARLKGARFVHAFETDEGKRLNAARMKNLTGNDKISARFLHHEYFDFEPTHTLWLGTNDKPDVDATDTGTWRRIKLVPFKSRFEGAREDKTLGDKLADEREGILAWAVRGAIAWWNRGKPSLIEPKVVTDAVGEYKGEIDRLSDFITARCDVNDKYEATAEELYGAYQHWAPTVGIRYPWTQTRFSSRFGQRQLRKEAQR